MKCLINVDRFGITFNVVLLFNLITLVFTGTVQQIYIKNNKVPVKGGDIQIVCDVSQFSNTDVVRAYKTDSIPPADITTAPSVTSCNPSLCIGTVPRYTFSTNSSGITITITNIHRSEDQKYWTCVINNQRKYMKLIVYTITPKLQYDNPPSQNQDIAQTSLTLKCRTGCAYPSPNFKWYYNKTTGSRQEWSSTAPVTEKTDVCTDSEKIYISTLTLPIYTVFTDNTDTTVKFQCVAISVTGAADDRFTQESVEVRFAVRVASVTLNYGNSVASNPLEVTSGEPHKLTCTSSVSRPTTTIIWYIGGQVLKRETASTSNFTFTPEFTDNQKQVYCKAFNIQSESQAVSSNRVSLYVKEKVANLTLKDGNAVLTETLEITNGVPKTLTCTASESRPIATIVWFIGDDVKKMENVTMSTFIFTPVISDHSKQVYCKASQSGNPDVFSNRVLLYVKVLASTPTITELTTEKLEGDQINFQCTTSQTRPVAIVTWKLNTQELTDVQNTEHNHGNNLITVTSIVKLTANRTDNNKIIYCETAVPGQSNSAKAQEKITIYWPPSPPIISTSNFPFLEGQTGKSIYCSSSDFGNPVSTATWTTRYGTPDIVDSRKLKLTNLTYHVNGSPVKCQLYNLFTQKKIIQIQSRQIVLQVEYSPRIQILVDEKPEKTVTRNEGERLSVTCNAAGNPTPVISWVGQQSSELSLSFDDIDRTDHGNYSCRAAATSTLYPSHNFVTEKELAVVVNYAPDVTVEVSNVNPRENGALIIRCKPVGRPADYIFSSLIQKWGSILIPNKYASNNGVIKIQNVQLQDSGTYVCKANNGIPDRNQRLDQSGNVTVKVKVSPILLQPAREMKFFGKLGIATNITMPFYSDPPPQTVQFEYKNGTVLTNSTKCSVSFFKGKVKDNFYGQEVELDGNFAQLQIYSVEDGDFVNYTLVIDNGMGSDNSWVIELIYENIPDEPKNFILEKQLSTESSFTVTWNTGNDNGHQQTFILKYRKISDDEWKNMSISDTGEDKMIYTISGLSSGTYYEIVLYASNMLGNSEDSGPIIVKTKGTAAGSDCICANTCSNTQAVTVGLCLGIIIVILVMYGTYVTVLLKRKCENKAESSSDQPGKGNVPLYTNMVFSSNDSGQHQDTGLQEPGDSQYMTLNTELRDDRQTYEVLRE